mmetsp:Transcript_40615/g.77555  ORF Transcript_40615/g.77555 Transcript_40615/m.77555 type:complete len:254 (-) Transcript_40615:1303-2064(-)
MLVLCLVLVPSFSPLGNCGAMEDHNTKERVQQQDTIWGNGRHIQQRRCRSFKRIGHQCWLDHDERPRDALAVEHQPEEGCLVGTVVEHLQELRPSQVEHELREKRKRAVDAEALRVVLVVLPELGGDADEHAVEPAQHVKGVLVVRFVGGVARHQHRRSLLIKSRHQVLSCAGAVGPAPCGGGDSDALLPAPVRVACDILQREYLARRYLIGVLIHHFVVNRNGSAVVQATNLPSGCVPHTYLRLSNCSTLLL